MKTELETRLCRCGCGETFRVLPTSPAMFSSANHVRWALDSKDPSIVAAAQAFRAEQAARAITRAAFIRSLPKLPRGTRFTLTFDDWR